MGPTICDVVVASPRLNRSVAAALPRLPNTWTEMLLVWCRGVMAIVGPSLSKHGCSPKSPGRTAIQRPPVLSHRLGRS